MSRVFDALLRSEAERSGAGETQTSSAQELLAEAERNAALQRRGEVAFVIGGKCHSAISELPGESNGAFAERLAGPSGPEVDSGKPMSREALLADSQRALFRFPRIAGLLA